ncbi:hypothetical protein SPRG_02851 [Saprolegnia parasitica CBS 223.65]|uniref:Uncharacterized protein n=1 Tax=Saprolegnia parasitica (strain CBS 223.65) TaxID=695850 RepID=A0A067CNU5_SAPPC|nr:hypothetical protein SPRG_02851 [Saprolegnia parasitica CBS 223.65]KDO32374.1 hypothetical protein SPRG_02851 [Saprolegnia parasitica CBS 223.65]|eukprot:XP_012196828.1 hypothetical protein SPRG_02851 [Saprolegnia parasitica CBS 223.65]
MPLDWTIDAEQRGLAAWLRQRDDNAHRNLLTYTDRLLLNQFLDRVVLDASLSQSPHYDARLSVLATRLGVRDPVVFYVPTHRAIQRQDREREERKLFDLEWRRQQAQHQTFVAAAADPSPAWCSLL